MSTLLEMARLLVLSSLVGIAIACILLIDPTQAVIVVGSLNAMLVAASGWALWGGRQKLYSLAVGASLLLNVSALVLLTEESYATSWIAFGFGLLALLAGNHTCHSAEVLAVRRRESGESTRSFYRAAVRGYVRIVLFVGLVMVVSLVILLLSLNAAIGALPSWAMAALALMAMVFLAILVRTRHLEA